MKRNISKAAVVLLAICLVLTFTACGSGSSDGVKVDTNDLYGSYMAANALIQDASSVSLNMDTSISISYGGESIDVSMKGPVKYAYNSDKSDMKLYMDLATDMYGTSLDLEAWYKDGWLYTNSMGQKIKVKQSMDDVMGTTGMKNVEFPKEAIIDQKYEDVADGTKISFTIKGDALEALTRDAIGDQLGDLAASLGGDYSFTYNDATVSTVIGKDGMPKSVTLNMAFAMEAGGMSMDMNMDMTMGSIVVGDVTIDYPSDLDSYTDSTGE